MSQLRFLKHEMRDRWESFKAHYLVGGSPVLEAFIITLFGLALFAAGYVWGSWS